MKNSKPSSFRFVLLLLIGFLLGFPTTSLATHVMGAHVSYQNIDSLKYKVIFKYYRWCNGVAFSNPSSATKVRALTGGSAGLTLTLDSIKEVDAFCPTQSGECTPSNTYGTGEGVEEHTYSVIVDFGDSSLSFYPLRNSKVIFETGQCCRNSAINTGAANNYFYTYAELDLTKSVTNSSPVITGAPYAILCCNQPFYGSYGAIDTADGDSLSYHWGHPLSNYNTSISYAGTNYNYNHPFRAYYPGSYTPPYSNPTAQPPIGIYLDPNSGDLTFTPTRCDEVTVAVVEVKEWRKDSNGVYQQLGMVRHDMQYITKTCLGNNTPTIDGPYSYSVCEGETLCFTVQSKDVNYIPPPPLLPGAPDTTTLTWNHGIPGASFTIVDTNAREKKANFCWTPPVGASSTLPYRFIATVHDDNCPIEASSVRSFSILVKPKIKADILLDTLSCGFYAVSVTMDSNSIVGSASGLWQVFDTAGNPVTDSTFVYFGEGSTPTSSTLSDTLKVLRSGVYVLQLSLRSVPDNCKTVLSDTLDVQNIVSVNIVNEDDTVCANSEVKLITYSTGSGLDYDWSVNGNLLVDSSTTLDADLRTAGEDLVYRATVTDLSGCSAFDEVRLVTFPDVSQHLDKEYTSCGDSVEIDRSDYADVVWSNGSGVTRFVVPASGSYWVGYTDSLGCSVVDSFDVMYYNPPTDFLPADTLACGRFEFYGLDQFDSILWENGTQDPNRVILSSGTYTAAVVDENGCMGYDTIVLQIAANPVVVLEDTSHCGEINYAPAQLSANVSILWSNGNTTASIPVNTSGTYKIQITDANGCTADDSAAIEIFGIPEVGLLGDTSVCADSLWLEAKTNTSYRWSTGDATQRIEARNSGQYWVRVTDGNNCENTDTVYIEIFGLPNVPVITKTGDSIFSNQNGYHRWYLNSTLLPDTGSAIGIFAYGTYSAQLVDTNGCVSSSSNTITKTSGVSLLKQQLSIAPNPTNGMLVVHYKGAQNIMALDIRLYTINGKEIPVEKQYSGTQIKLHWDDLPAQVLWLVVRNADGSFHRQVLEL